MSARQNTGMHRPTTKMANKKHKSGRHRTKSECKGDSGRMNQHNAFRGGAGRKINLKQSRKDRRHNANQNRTAKRAANFERKRAGARAPHFVVVVGLGGVETDPTDVITKLGMSTPGAAPDGPFLTAQPANLKQAITLAPASRTDIMATLHLCSAADSVVFAMSATSPTDEFGKLCISCLRAQGIPAVAHVVVGLEQIKPKQRSDTKRFLIKQAEDDFPDTKFHVLEPGKEAAILWGLSNQKRKDVKWRDIHTYITAHETGFTPGEDVVAADGTSVPGGTLTVRGYVRGRALDVNRLVYLPSVGAFQLSQVDVAVPGDTPKVGDGMAAEAAAATTSHFPDAAAIESLQSEVPIDPLAGEQTWPTDDEIAASRGENVMDKELTGEAPAAEARLVRVPKGTSSYQANWIVDAFDLEGAGKGSDGAMNSDADDGIDEVDEDAVADDLDDTPGAGGATADAGRKVTFAEEVDDGTELVSLEVGADGMDTAAAYDEEMDGDEDKAEREQMLLARDEQVFPDEVDAPLDMLAKVRFQKYRGLQTFRHSPWDPREELPIEYARIFQFQNFRSTANRIMRESEDNFEVDELPGQVGTMVTLHIKGVPTQAAQNFAALSADRPLVVYSLLQHENKTSVLNFKLSMVREFSEPIKSKSRLVFYSGLRQFSCEPIFSSNSIGEKHKFERYWQVGSPTIATTFGPIHFCKPPTIVFKQSPTGKLELVATGSMVSVNPDRMVIKRIRIAGHPLKINKNSATIRWMFYTPEDIHWFKPVELITKYGRRGHIRESLGTHGHMKCVFDGQLISQDTVLMNLYKRVYPKWKYAEGVAPALE